MQLRWYPAESADEYHDDQDTDLAATGTRASWARVWQAACWNWAVYAYWLWEDIDKKDDAVLAEGTAPSEDAAKEAVTNWIRQNVT